MAIQSPLNNTQTCTSPCGVNAALYGLGHAPWQRYGGDRGPRLVAAQETCFAVSGINIRILNLTYLSACPTACRYDVEYEQRRLPQPVYLCSDVCSRDRAKSLVPSPTPPRTRLGPGLTWTCSENLRNLAETKPRLCNRASTKYRKGTKPSN